jgi:hypothetical protein
MSRPERVSNSTAAREPVPSKYVLELGKETALGSQVER